MTKNTNVNPIKRIPWEQFYSDIELVRYRGKEQVRYVGTITVDGVKFKSEFNLERKKFDENLDKLAFMDGFVKEQIADDLANQINRRVMSNVTNLQM
jgi:hypothetical protein